MVERTYLIDTSYNYLRHEKCKYYGMPFKPWLIYITVVLYMGDRRCASDMEGGQGIFIGAVSFPQSKFAEKQVCDGLILFTVLGVQKVLSDKLKCMLWRVDYYALLLKQKLAKIIDFITLNGVSLCLVMFKPIAKADLITLVIAVISSTWFGKLFPDKRS